jgi:hypothetical protein
VETPNTWAQVLKRLRESDEVVLLGLVSNLTVTFTSDEITLHAPNRGVFDILSKNKAIFNCDLINIKLKKPDENGLTIDQKMVNLFGEKFELR